MSLTSRPINSEYAEKLDRSFGIKNCFMEYNDGSYVMTSKFSEIGQQILDFHVREDDVWMVSYARTGSTWAQEMAWLIRNDLNFDEAKRTIQNFRAPVLEISAFLVTDEYAEFMKSYGNSVDFLEKCPSPRFIKTHLPFSLLPTQMQKVKPKIIYIARDPKDVCVSYYHYCGLIHNLHCNFEEFCDFFLNDKLPIGSIWSHYLQFWEKRHEPNILFLKYEDMKQDLKAVIRKTAQFLEKTLTEQEVDALSDYLSFDKMKSNRAVNLDPILEQIKGEDYRKSDSDDFIRKGETGDWKNYMTPELSEKFDLWIKENSQKSGLYSL